MTQKNQDVGKALYAFLFLLFIPAALWAWGYYSNDFVTMPVVQSASAGIILGVIGIGLMLWAMYFLKAVGKGLPMNAFPPVNFVSTGPYYLFRHPIYVGFALLLFGISIYTGSASGLWLVTPLTILSMIALVMGYEAIDLQNRFPDRKHQALFNLPEQSDDKPQTRDRLVSIAWIVSMITFHNFILMTVLEPVSDQIVANDLLSFFNQYGWVWVALIALVLKTKIALRQWLICSLLSIALLTFMALFYSATAKPLQSQSVQTLLFVPTIILLLGIQVLMSSEAGWQTVLILPLSGLVIVQIVFSQEPVYYGLINVAISGLVFRYQQCWLWLRNTAESIANSWKEWTIGRVRVINHGFYVGAGAGMGIMMAGLLAGKNYAFSVLIFAVIVTISSALWAQLVEGSEKLKRPFGYYGGLVGIIFGSVVVWAWGSNAWVIIGLFSVAMPWVQATGRLRCLVNGCCHGKKTNNPFIGIRYHHPRSRVCHLSGAKGELLHPTQLYSILWLTVVGFVQLSLWYHHQSYAFIFGIYLILTSIGRFVEEAYRGEVQTPSKGGLRLYQWTAIIALIIGVGMTMIRVPNLNLDPGFNLASLGAAGVGGAFLTFAMGIDFPYSNARFSRLV